MRIPFNPFLVFVAVALVVVVVLAVISRHRKETQTLTAMNDPGATAGPSVAATLAVVLAVAVILVPFGIAVAVLWGPTIGIAAYFALVTAGLIGLAVSRRSHG